MLNKSILIKCLLPILILAAGFGGMRLLALSKQAPQKQERENLGALVETVTAQPEDRRIRVRGTGTVQPAQTTDIIPQVSGRVVSLSPNFVAGGFFEKGEQLFEIDSADYALAVLQSRAGVAQAEYRLAQVESQARIARIEWERINLENKGTPNPLVLQEPQLKNAKASLESARADLDRRLLDMERTKVYAPFDGRIRSESIDPGQYLMFGKSVGVIAGTESAEIVVPVSLDNLAWLDVPRDQQPGNGGSPAQVRLTAGAKTHTWPGQVVRSLGEVDPRGRMAQIVVRVTDPYNLKGQMERSGLDLAPGLFVEVWLHGKSVADVIAIPADALRMDSTVWIVDTESLLEIRPVSVLHREMEDILIGSGLSDGDRIVLTHLSGAAPGMKLRQIIGEVSS